MAKAQYLRGDKTPADFTATADVTADDVVVAGTSIGVVFRNLVSGEYGASVIDVGGCYEFPKVSGAVIKSGEPVFWDADAGEVDDSAAAGAAGDLADFGIALEDAGNGDIKVKVQLLPGIGTLS